MSMYLQSVTSLSWACSNRKASLVLTLRKTFKLQANW